MGAFPIEQSCEKCTSLHAGRTRIAALRFKSRGTVVQIPQPPPARNLNDLAGTPGAILGGTRRLVAQNPLSIRRHRLRPLFSGNPPINHMLYFRRISIVLVLLRGARRQRVKGWTA
jgi:hypothetical protein